MKIVYEDSYLLVCDKEAGVPVQIASLRCKDLTDEVRMHRNGGYVGVVHRLDQPVRGLVVFALNEECAAALSKQAGGSGKAKAAGRSMEKTYLALVQPEWQTGNNGLNAAQLLSGETVRLEHYLLRDGKTNTSRVVKAGIRGAKKAILEVQMAGLLQCWSGDAWQAVGETLRDGEALDAACSIFAEELDAVLAQQKILSLKDPEEEGGGQTQLAVLRIRLLTGRHHQIRVQLAAAGMPILGDRKYGNRENRENHENRPGNGARPEARFPALCAWKLRFWHPIHDTELVFQCSR